MFSSNSWGGLSVSHAFYTQGVAFWFGFLWFFFTLFLESCQITHAKTEQKWSKFTVIGQQQRIWFVKWCNDHDLSLLLNGEAKQKCCCIEFQLFLTHFSQRKIRMMERTKHERLGLESQRLSWGGGLGWENCHEFHYSNLTCWVAMTKTNYSFWKMRRHHMMDGSLFKQFPLKTNKRYFYHLYF